ncbi:MAG: TolC family protein, partial [Planctomycetota bacterium]|nr:TolC family protein [Planctomycetota bacterium]
MSTDSMVRGFVLVVVASCSSCRSTIVEPVLAAPWSAERAAAPLTREQCIDLALHSVPNEAAWSARVSSARAAVDRSALLANPIASLGFEDFGLNAKAAHNAVQTTLSIAAALEDVFARKRRHAAAVHDLEAEEATLRAERNRLAADVVRAYDELASARSKIELEERLSVIARDQRDAVRKFVAAGLAPRIQRDRADLELASTTASVERARA